MLAVVAPCHAFAVQPDEVLADAALEKRARALSAELRCLVCQNQSIDDSDAPLAKDLRVLVRERLTAGDSDEVVRAYVVDRFGEYVLLNPPVKLSTLLLWIAPFLVLAGALTFAVRSMRAQGSTEIAGTRSLSPDEERKLKEVIGSVSDRTR